MKNVVTFSANTTWYLLNFRKGTIRAFLERGYDVVTLSPRDEYVDGLEALGCRHIHIPMSQLGQNPLMELWTLARYALAYARLKPAMAFHFTIKSNVYGSLAARVLKVPYASNISGMGSAFNKRGVLQTLMRGLYQVSQKRATRVFFQNPEDMEYFRAAGIMPDDKVRLLPGSGVDLSHFAPHQRVRSPGAPFRFVFAGRILWEKGFPYLPDAIRVLKGRGLTVECVIYGACYEGNPKGVSRQQLAAWEAEGLLTYGGMLNDVRTAYEAADAVVLPTYYREGVPRSLLEASAMGKPLVATDWVGCREVVEDGVNGFLCAPRDAESLAAALEKMMALDEAALQRMAAAARDRVEQRFGEGLVVEAYVEALLGSKAGPGFGDGPV
jgi:glycosyltransferase involved in cell wall biosynthesis